MIVVKEKRERMVVAQPQALIHTYYFSINTVSSIDTN
jgi:hypothetical protein